MQSDKNLNSSVPIFQSKAWGDHAQDYSDYLMKTHFTRVWSKVALENTIHQDKSFIGSRALNILDIATGPGGAIFDVALEIEKLNPNSKITAIDFSPEMIKCNRENLEKLNIKNINPIVMDGQELQFEDNSFDYVYSFFGINMIPDREKALKEVYRVLKPGGKLLIVVWNYKSPFIILFTDCAKSLGLDLSLVQKYNKFKDPELVKMEFEAAGFKNVKVSVEQETYSMANENDTLQFIKKSPVISMLTDYLDKPTVDKLYDLYTEKYRQDYMLHENPDKMFEIVLGVGSKPL
eukprot:gene2189-2692_t